MAPWPSPNTKYLKNNLNNIFSKNSNMYTQSSFCNLLNQHLPNELKINPNTSGKELQATIQAMAEEGTLPYDETMEELLAYKDLIAQVEDIWIYLEEH